MSEWSAVQQPMIRYAVAAGWTHVPRDEALLMRGGDDRLLFFDTLKTQLLTLNPGILDDGRADGIIRQLTLLHADIEGNRDALALAAGRAFGLRAGGEPGAQCPPDRLR